MSTTTTNYGLTKPATTDLVDITVINRDLDTIDTQLTAANLRSAAGTVAVKGLYARTVPTPDSGGTIIPFCADPNNAGVVWAKGNTSGQLGYTTDHGATFTPVITPPTGGVAGMAPCQITITSGVAGGDFMFLVMCSGTRNQGQVWRSPAPNATGSNITFTQIFGYDTTTNLINGPGGVAAASLGAGENLRNSSFAITPDGAHAYILPYATGVPTAGVATRSDGAMAAGSPLLTLPTSQAFQGWEHGNDLTVTGAGAGGATLSTTIQRIWSVNCVQLAAPAQTAVTGATVTFHAPTASGDLCGGPILRVSANPCAANPAAVVWAAGKQWAFARHGHAVRVIGGVPWVSLGDYPYPQDSFGEAPLTHVGVWAGADTGGVTFNQKTIARTPVPWDAINIYPITINGQNAIIGESDSSMSTGPILIPTQSNAAGVISPRLLHQSVPPIVGTMRCLTVDATGNIFYFATSESGVIGPADAIMMAAPPYTAPIVLEQFAPSTLSSVYDSVLDGPYVWFGTSRITREEIIGQ